MSDVATAGAGAPATGARRIRWRALLTWALVILIIGAAANLLGWDLRGWFKDVWDTLTSIVSDSA